jgi:DnaK suppressor protein
LRRLVAGHIRPLASQGGARSEREFVMTATATMTAGQSAYRPSDDEPFMNERQLAYFKQKLMDWKDDILRESKGTVVNLKAETENHPDLVDRASSESDRALELRTRDRQRKLISKIDEALRRIEDGSYGYCEETGEPIGLGRLEARPTATLSVEAQERHERRERVHRDD